MRGPQNFQGATLCRISLEDRVPQRHPLRKLRALVDALLATMSADFDAVYSKVGRPSVPPEILLKALLLQILFSVRSERLLVEAIDYNLLYRWFVGLNLEERVWEHSTFSANRERLFNKGLAGVFFGRVKHAAGWAKLTSDEHFSVDGTLIDAWASRKSFRRRDDDSAPPPGRQALLCFATYNLVRMGSIGGWCAHQTLKGGKSAPKGIGEPVKTEIDTSFSCQGDKIERRR